MHEPPNLSTEAGSGAWDRAAPATLVGAWIARSVAEWSMRTARIDRQSCMRSSHAPRARNPEPRVYAKTVKLNPVKPTLQERCVEKPRAAPPPLGVFLQTVYRYGFTRYTRLPWYTPTGTSVPSEGRGPSPRALSFRPICGDQRRQPRSLGNSAD
jgi:hypothetical protein